MSKLLKIILTLVVCFMFIGSLGTAPRAQAAPNIPPQLQQVISKDGNAVGITAAGDQTAATLSYWTLERQQAAKPLEVKISSADLNSMTSADSTGPAVMKPGGMGDPAAVEAAQAKYPDAFAAADKIRSESRQPSLKMPSLVDPTGTKNVGDLYDGNWYTAFYTTYPYRTIGKLFFDDGVYGYSCTAAMISDNNIIVTSAHCIYNTDYNFWYQHWLYVPAYFYGVAPLGTYGWSSATVNVAWQTAKSSSKGAALDVGLIHLGGNPAGLYGYMGWGYNWNAKNLRTKIGYASNWFTGSETWICHSESYTKGSLIADGCPINNTAGGSPSILFYYPYLGGGYNWVDAVVFGNADAFNIQSTRFTNKNILTICAIAGC